MGQITHGWCALTHSLVTLSGDTGAGLSACCPEALTVGHLNTLALRWLLQNGPAASLALLCCLQSTAVWAGCPILALEKVRKLPWTCLCQLSWFFFIFPS